MPKCDNSLAGLPPAGPRRDYCGSVDAVGEHTSPSIITARPARANRAASQARRCQSLNQGGSRRPASGPWVVGTVKYCVTDPSCARAHLQDLHMYARGDRGPRENDESGRLDSFGVDVQAVPAGAPPKVSNQLRNIPLLSPPVPARTEIASGGWAISYCVMSLVVQWWFPSKSPIRVVLFGFPIEQRRRGGRARLRQRLVHL